MAHNDGAFEYPVAIGMRDLYNLLEREDARRSEEDLLLDPGEAHLTWRKEAKE